MMGYHSGTDDAPKLLGDWGERPFSSTEPGSCTILCNKNFRLIAAKIAQSTFEEEEVSRNFATVRSHAVTDRVEGSATLNAQQPYHSFGSISFPYPRTIRSGDEIAVMNSARRKVATRAIHYQN